jgi:hypothetical protein
MSIEPRAPITHLSTAVDSMSEKSICYVTVICEDGSVWQRVSDRDLEGKWVCILSPDLSRSKKQ